MGAEIDRLEIQVEAQAAKANAQLDNLVKKLDRVSASLSGVNSRGLATMGAGVNKLANAMNNFANNTKTTDFSRLSRNLSTLSQIDVSNFSRVAGGVNQLTAAINSIGNISDNALQVAEFTNSISKLGNANVQKAIANLPALATAMNNFMATMSKAPGVNKNIIDMTNALANLASQGAKVGTAGNSLTTSTNRIGVSMEKTTKKARSFSSVLGSIYQKYFWVMRAGSKLWDSIKSSMDYVEVLNYFDAAFGQVADSAVSQWEDAGADSAQAYFVSFSDRAKQLTTKMTGFTITESGMLESTGGKSLGINPSTLMNYQAMFAQMSNSIGITAETSLKLSTALTEIGADLASVKNMDFDKVWKDMASGLAGMSRTLDKYGVNIRNVNLQQKLTGLGINANIAALNQNEKALLRTIILLDSTRYAWGDLAETINQPANQLRLLQANFGNLARTIGNIFLPVVAKVLPYINALVIALQRLAEWIVKLLGFEDFDWGGSSGTGGSEFDDLLGSIGDTEEGLEDATSAAKKLRTQLLGIDELNVLNQDDDSAGSGIGGLGGYGGILEGALDKILEEYQRAWDEAFANMEERYNQFADNVANAFKEKGLFGVGEYFGEELTKALNSIPWDSIYEGARGFGKGLADFLSGLISPELFGAVGKTIASALNTAIYSALSFGENFDFYDFGASIATGINEFFETFDFEALAETLNVWVDGIEDTIRGFLDDITWESILEGIGDFLGELELDTVTFIVGTFAIKKILKTTILSSAMTSLGKSIAAHLGTVSFIKKLGEALALWKGGAGTLGESLETMFPTASKIVSWIPHVAIAGAIVGVGAKIKEEMQKLFDTNDWGIGDWIVNTLKTSFKGWKSELDNLAISLELWWQDTWLSNKLWDLGQWFNANIKPWLSEQKWMELFANIKSSAETKWNEFTVWFSETGFSKWFNESVAPYFSETDWTDMYSIIQSALQCVWGNLTTWWQESALYSWWNNDVKPWFELETWQDLMTNIKTALENVWTEVVNWWTNTAIYRWYNDNVKPWFDEKKWTFSGIKDGLSKAFNAAIDAIKGIWNTFATWLNDALTFDFEGFTKSFEVLGETYEIGIPAFSVSLGKLPTFATGGFPEDGLFFANHNELVGQFSNGKTAVANNEMIVAGIEEAAYRGFSRANAENTREVALLEELIVAVREGKDIQIDGRSLVAAYDERKVRNGYVF